MAKESSLKSKAVMRLSLVYAVLCFGIMISTTNSATNSTTASTNASTQRNNLSTPSNPPIPTTGSTNASTPRNNLSTPSNPPIQTTASTNASTPRNNLSTPSNPPIPTTASTNASTPRNNLSTPSNPPIQTTASTNASTPRNNLSTPSNPPIPTTASTNASTPRNNLSTPSNPPIPTTASTNASTPRNNLSTPSNPPIQTTASTNASTPRNNLSTPSNPPIPTTASTDASTPRSNLSTPGNPPIPTTASTDASTPRNNLSTPSNPPIPTTTSTNASTPRNNLSTPNNTRIPTTASTNAFTPRNNLSTPSNPPIPTSTASTNAFTPRGNLSTPSNTPIPTTASTNAFTMPNSHSTIPTIKIPTDYCPSEKGGSDEPYGVFSWPKTMFGRRAIIPCPHDPKKNASRWCGFKGAPETSGEGFSDKGRNVPWEAVDAHDCPPSSERSKDIYALSQKALNVDNVNETSQQVKNVSSPGTTLKPGDIGNIATILENIVAVKEKVDEVVDDFLATIDNTLDANLESVLQSQQNTNSSSRIVEALNILIETLTISLENGFQRTLKNYAVDASLVQPRSFRGLTFAGIINNTNIGLGNTSIVKALSDDEEVSAPKATTIRIPSTIFNDSFLTNLSSPQRVILSLYKETKLFQVTNQSETEFTKRLNGYVIAGSIKALPVSNLKNPVQISFANLKPGDKNSALCSFWNFTQGNWSQEGCELRGVSPDGRIICSCNHLTNFAMLMDIYPHEETSHDRILGLISYIGCGLSLAGLMLTIITLLVLKELRSKIPGQILLNFCIALSLTLIVFLAAAERSKTSSLASCRAAAIALHYFLLVAFMWMALEAFNMYLAFVKVLPTYVPKFMLKCCVVAWGIPAVIVSITIGVALDDYGDDKYCRLLGVAFLVSFLAPILLILLGNTIAFVLIVRSLLTSGSKVTSDRRTAGYQQLRQGIAIMVLLGLTWLFGILAISDAKLVFQYLFCIFNSLQGLCVFVFYCILSSGTKKQWRVFLRRKKVTLRGQTGKLDSQSAIPRHGNYTASSNLGKNINSESAESAFILTTLPEKTSSFSPYKTPVTDVEMGCEETGSANTGFAALNEDIPLNTAPEDTRSFSTFKNSPTDFEIVCEGISSPKSEFVAKEEILLKILHPGMTEYTVKNESCFVSSVEITLKNNTNV